MADKTNTVQSFIRQHSLSVAAVSILILWIVLYSVSDPGTHVGSFFGNAIADWAGVVVTVLATKYMFEKGSAESRSPADKGLNPAAPMAARSFSDHIPADHGRWLGCAICSHELGGQVGPGRGKYRFRVDADFRAGTDDEATDRTAFEGEREGKLKA